MRRYFVYFIAICLFSNIAEAREASGTVEIRVEIVEFSGPSDVKKGKEPAVSKDKDEKGNIIIAYHY